MNTADYFIKNLNMTPHPEGGFYKEIYASEENITSNDLKVDFGQVFIFYLGTEKYLIFTDLNLMKCGTIIQVLR